MHSAASEQETSSWLVSDGLKELELLLRAVLSHQSEPILMVDDDRFRLKPGETPVTRSVRFRTLGCYPLTGAVESTAATLPEVIQEMLLTTTSERQGRAIDHDQTASMEKKKQEGYF